MGSLDGDDKANDKASDKANDKANDMVNDKANDKVNLEADPLARYAMAAAAALRKNS